MNDKPSIRIVDFKPMTTGSLRGFCTVGHGSGMIITDCTVHRSADRWWVSPPGRLMVSRDGVALKDAATGKFRYSQVISFKTKEIRDRWSASVLEALRAAHPEVFDDGR